MVQLKLVGYNNLSMVTKELAMVVLELVGMLQTKEKG